MTKIKKILMDFGRKQKSYSEYLAMLSIIPILVIMSIFNWTLILQSRYHNTVWGTIRLAVMTTLLYPGRSVLMLMLAVVPFAMLFIAEGNLIIVLMAAVTLTGLLQTVLYDRVLRRLEQTDKP